MRDIDNLEEDTESENLELTEFGPISHFDFNRICPHLANIET